jgi:hypothetical protein
MTTGGIQTHDFLMRLRKSQDTLPRLILQMARLMARQIEEIKQPQVDDIRNLQEQLRQMIGDADELRNFCGTEGNFCGQCPFGAYLPTGFAYASETQALCLPWIVVVHPMPRGPSATAD